MLAAWSTGDWLVPGGAGGRRAVLARPRARLARRAGGGAVEEVRRDDALVRSAADPAGPRGQEDTDAGAHPRAAAPCRVPRVLRPGDQRPPRHRRAGRQALRRGRRRGRASTRPRTGSSPPDERIDMLTEACAGWDNVRVDGFTGLLTDFCLEHDDRRDRQGAAGGQRLRLRAADGADELRLAPVETVFVPTSPEWSFLRPQPGQGGRDLRRRRVRPGARVRARAAREAAGRAPARADADGSEPRSVLPFTRHAAATIPRFCLCPDPEVTS